MAKPTASPDEQFHGVITGSLEEWWRERGGTCGRVRGRAAEPPGRGVLSLGFSAFCSYFVSAFAGVRRSLLLVSRHLRAVFGGGRRRPWAPRDRWCADKSADGALLGWYRRPLSTQGVRASQRLGGVCRRGDPLAEYMRCAAGGRGGARGVRLPKVLTSAYRLAVTGL